jgi:hypothetical protein
MGFGHTTILTKNNYLEEQGKPFEFKTYKVVEDEGWPSRACHTSADTRSSRKA